MDDETAVPADDGTRLWTRRGGTDGPGEPVLPRWERDIRPRRAVDSLERVRHRVRRTMLAGAGHLPWTEDPEGFRSAVGAFLA
ncbi:hypothetical protein [Streptomyces sp. NRRL F-5135]|uniref:hypothetical protein n=1 Tax=Streptomyces sp. NRRL F-5135 TaxID=1463858 RepID=UPI0004C5DB14|nr:hypothetical protein [Streptomyces sp. NRRL F-5135]